jgi:hypothetical protein
MIFMRPGLLFEIYWLHGRRNWQRDLRGQAVTR